SAIAAPALGGDHDADRSRDHGRDVLAQGGRPGVPPAMVRPRGEPPARPVRRELEPAADLRLHRWADLRRASGAGNWMVGQPPALGVRPVPPRRPKTLSRPAIQIFSASRWVVHPATD